MALGSHFGPFLMLKWSQVGTNIGTKTDLNLKRRISTKYCKTNDFFNIFGVRGSGLTTKIRPKTVKKRSQHRNTFWHRFLVDFGSILGGFWEAQTDPKPIENGSKNMLKNGTLKKPL